MAKTIESEFRRHVVENITGMTEETRKKVFSKMFDLIKIAADKAKEDAGYSGSWTDGGAQRMLDEVQLYQQGMSGFIPEMWRKYYDKAVKDIALQEDPEYNAYLEAKKKCKEFESRYFDKKKE